MRAHSGASRWLMPRTFESDRMERAGLLDSWGAPPASSKPHQHPQRNQVDVVELAVLGSAVVHGVADLGVAVPTEANLRRRIPLVIHAQAIAQLVALEVRRGK